MSTSDGDDSFLRDSYDKLRQTVAARVKEGLVLPNAHDYDHATKTLQTLLLDPGMNQGTGRDATLAHLLHDIVPALNGENLSGRYYGFVIGSTLPIAEAADNIVTSLDQNAHMHLPGQSVSAAVEDVALRALIRLLRLDPDSTETATSTSASSETVWSGRIVTTGATASNILGLACGREATIRRRHPRGLGPSELGLLTACREAGVQDIQVLTSMGHSSLSKAASVVGLGSGAVKELPLSAAEPWRLDLDAVEREVQRGDSSGVVSIIVVSAGEVNTGRFATRGEGDMRRLRALADRYQAWLHVDGAFGLLARILPQDDARYTPQVTAVQGLELADSLTGDAHKLFNVPYDAGFFLCRDVEVQTRICQNPNAAYLTAPSSSSSASLIHHPLNIGLENSRRFRALPIYAVLHSEGEEGLRKMLCRMVEMGRRVAAYIHGHEHYQLLPLLGETSDGSQAAGLQDTWMVVLFRDARSEYNDVLTQRINQTRRIYVSGTSWAGEKATRIAVSSWRVDVEKDIAVVTEVLDALAQTAPGK